jgi:DsbC/DsbD-like thiol-disulfide interchange protein
MLACAVLAGGVVAQPLNPTVHWEASLLESRALGPGSTAALAVSAQIESGWHVYALTQAPGGPTALQVTVDQNPVLESAGKPSGPAPETRHDPSFDLDTAYYAHEFALQIPVVVKQAPGLGRQWIPISVRFQSCSDRECRPPTTVHLRVPIDLLPSS